MKKFLAIYVGTAAAFEKAQWNQMDEKKRKAREAEGLQAWMDWGVKHGAAIVDQGSPLGKTKRVSPEGLSDIKNVMTGYVIIEAESHEAAAKMFENHPHFSVFPGDSVEIMECVPFPSKG
jgi:hypothetical protein